jgi:hypothetical protein
MMPGDNSSVREGSRAPTATGATSETALAGAAGIAGATDAASAVATAGAAGGASEAGSGAPLGSDATLAGATTATTGSAGADETTGSRTLSASASAPARLPQPWLLVRSLPQPLDGVGGGWTWRESAAGSAADAERALPHPFEPSDDDAWPRARRAERTSPCALQPMS